MTAWRPHELERIAAMNAAAARFDEPRQPIRTEIVESVPERRETAAERGRRHAAAERAIVERKPTGEGLHPLSDRWRTMQRPASEGDERP